MAKFETVASFMSSIEAHIAKGRLESEEIPSFVAHANHIWPNWGYANALGGVKIKVFEKNADKAKKYWINILMANKSPISMKCLQIYKQTSALNADQQIIRFGYHGCRLY